MVDQDELARVLTSLNINISYTTVDAKFVRIEKKFCDVNEAFKLASELQLNKWKVAEDNFIKYEKHSNALITQQRLELIEIIGTFQEESQDAKEMLKKLNTDLKERKKERNNCREHVKELQRKIEASKKVHEKAVEYLKPTINALSVAIGYYQRFLGIQLQYDRIDPNRIILIYGSFDDCFRPGNHTIPLSKNGDHYLVNESNVEPGPDLIRILLEGRDIFVRSQVSNDASAFVSQIM